MSESHVINLEDVSVLYHVPRENVRTFKEYIIRILQRGKIHHDEFLALDNVNLEIEKGEYYGIVGSNGAGKSTLLKLIAKVMRPTSGRVWVKGKVAPLLAMGAGFHPDLTGRENVFLNGTLLGYSRDDLKERFDRIVDFAGLHDFIDAPIRTYSSGMTMRLAFSVATDIKPDILLVDEVLSVGDAVFQEKSMDRIRRYQREGTTIVMVSHSMSTITDNCNRAAWLDKGQFMFLGDPDEAVKQYLENTRDRKDS